MSDVRAIFDKAIELAAGKKIIIPASGESHRESLRTAFYRQRTKWKNAIATGEDIIISRFSYKGSYCVLLEKVAAAPPAMILNEEGDIEEFLVIRQGVIKQDQSNAIVGDLLPDDEEGRMRQTMRDDGISEEEIEEYFTKPEEIQDDRT